jgi:glucose dehydrogenase
MQNQQNTGYSNQTIVNATNVGTLKLRWSLQLGSSKLGGLSGSPVVSNNLVYVTSSLSIYAINESTGKIKWSDGPGNVTGAISTRVGVTIANGFVFAGTDSNLLLKLNAVTGAEIASVSIVQNIIGSLISYQGAQATPLVYNGQVIIGETLGDAGARGFVRAFNESNLNLLWTFYTVPPAPISSANQASYGNSWGTNGSTGCECGGGAVWNVPAVDPKTGTIFFGTGNPSPGTTSGVLARTPVYNNGVTPYPNLYTDSIIALNSTDGKLIWYFQEVPGDQNDHDQGMPVQLFSTMINGSTTPSMVVGGGSKDGYYYVLNETNGKMFYKVKAGVHENDNSTAGSVPPSQIFPGMDGGLNTFTSFDPLTNMIYAVAHNKPQNCTYSVTACPKYHLNSTLYAINASSGNIVWQTNFNNGGLSGGVSSTNNLVFTSDGNHTFYALNGFTGSVLWSHHDPSGGGAGTVLWTWGAPSITNGTVFETTMGTSTTGMVEAFMPGNLLPTVTISLGSVSESVVHGHSIANIATIAGGTQLISFTVSGLPSKAKLTWTFNPVADSTSGVSDKLTVKTSTTTHRGTFVITIIARGTDGNSAKTTFRLTVT